MSSRPLSIEPQKASIMDNDSEKCSFTWEPPAPIGINREKFISQWVEQWISVYAKTEKQKSDSVLAMPEFLVENLRALNIDPDSLVLKSVGDPSFTMERNDGVIYTFNIEFTGNPQSTDSSE